MRYFIGLMSGTSMDGVDAVLCAIDTHTTSEQTAPVQDLISQNDTPDSTFQDTHWFSTLERVSLPFPEPLLATLNSLCQPSVDEINTMGAADVEVAKLFAKAVDVLLDKTGFTASEITALGSHGQTIRHYPTGTSTDATFPETGFTLQIGDPNTLAALTGIPVVADFRRKDIALGGQGAPLVPAFHHAVFGRKRHRVDCHQNDRYQDTHHHPEKELSELSVSSDFSACAIVNIGGIANISIIDNEQGTVSGFDSGPGNTLMDKWVSKHLQQPYDDNGRWAESGQVNSALLNAFLSDPYFKKAAPKSTGREYFNSRWVSSFLKTLDTIAPEDVQATLCQLTANHIADAIKAHGDIGEIFVCGGGAFNSYLLHCLQALLSDKKVLTTHALGICPQDVEGAAFAWLAYAYFERICANVPAVTGAKRSAILGGLYLP